MKLMLTIKQKILLTVTLAVLMSTILVGVLSQRSAREVVEQRMLGSELPSLMLQIRNKLDLEISTLMNGAEQLAHSQMLKHWLEQGRPEAEVPLVISQLKDMTRQYHLAQVLRRP